ncbi:MAG TPA: NINE protein [Ktedonobacterales bacterium]|nr:NINE protein [Ktedonobacterales bacterium]
MSVDISQLTAKLDPQRQEMIREQYEERATNPTAAFLLCFFLGSAGAHRFYLGEWRVALAHLALFVAGVAALVAGLTQTLPLTEKLANHPVGALLDALGVVLLLVALIWEIIDLGRIDHQVYQRNLLLAEGIIAGNLLADHTVEDQAIQRAEANAARAQAQAQAAGIAAPVAGAAATGAGIITASEVADARKLAEEHAGSATISYSEMSRFDVSADPDQDRADAERTGDWTTTNTTTDTLPGATPDAAPIPVAETVTRTHTEEGSRVTDGYEIDRVSGPSALEVAGLGAAGLGAAALGAGLYGAAHEATHEPAPEPAPSYEPYEPAGFDEPTQPAYPPSASEPPQFDATDAPDAQAAAAPAYAYDFGDDLGDITDANMPAVAPPAADVASANASPAYVQLPDERQAPGWEPAAPFSALPEEEPSTAVYHAPPPPLPGEPDYFAPHSAEAPAESYVPPVASVYSSPAEAPVAPTPSWDQPTSPQPEPQPSHDEHLGELAGLAGVAGAGALAGEAWAHSHHEPEPAPEPVAAAPEPPKMKRIRVRRKVVVDGEVVAEEVVEREIPADMDTKTAAEQIQAELGHLTPEQIAQRAHLSPDEEVELRQRTEGL